MLISVFNKSLGSNIFSSLTFIVPDGILNTEMDMKLNMKCLRISLQNQQILKQIIIINKNK